MSVSRYHDKKWASLQTHKKAKLRIDVLCQHCWLSKVWITKNLWCSVQFLWKQHWKPAEMKQVVHFCLRTTFRMLFVHFELLQMTDTLWCCKQSNSDTPSECCGSLSCISSQINKHPMGNHLFLMFWHDITSDIELRPELKCRSHWKCPSCRWSKCPNQIVFECCRMMPHSFGVESISINCKCLACHNFKASKDRIGFLMMCPLFVHVQTFKKLCQFQMVNFFCWSVCRCTGWVSNIGFQTLQLELPTNMQEPRQWGCHNWMSWCS